MLWFVLWVVSLWVLPAAQTPAPPSPAPIRFHHLHYRVADPLSAMKRVARTAADTPTILQGLGVGVIGSVRANGEPEYVLFDRRAPDAAAASPVDVAAAYPVVVSWLHAHGIEVAPEAGHVAELAAKVPGESLDHIAFSTPNLPEIVAALRRGNVRFTEPNDEAVLFQVTTGATGSTLTVEIVRDPDLPDAFWCPMHPDVRSAAPGSCPICRMTLVPIPVPRVGEYRMVVSWLSPSRAGAKGLRIAIVYPGGEAPPATSGAMSGHAVPWLPSLLPVHDKRLHLFIVSRDLSYFAHTHPEQVADGSFELAQPLPAGEYMVIADFLPADGTPQLVQRAIITPGFAWPSPLVAVAAPVPSATATVDGIRATMDAADVVAGRSATVRVTLTDARSGAPVADLEPYLSAPAHGLFVSADLTQAAHAHPREQDLFGSTFSFDFLPASSGIHKFWVQVQRHGQVVTFPFVLVVG